VRVIQQDRLLQLINSVELPATVDSLLQDPGWRNSRDLNPGCWGHMSGSLKATFSRRRYRTTRWFLPCAMARSPAAESISSDRRPTLPLWPATDLVRGHDCSNNYCPLWRLGRRTRPTLVLLLSKSLRRRGWSIDVRNDQQRYSNKTGIQFRKIKLQINTNTY